MAYRPGSRDPRYRPAGTVDRVPAVPAPRRSPEQSPVEVRRRAQLAAVGTCQWQHRGVRCVAVAEVVVVRADGGLRSICREHVRAALFDRRAHVL